MDVDGEALLRHYLQGDVKMEDMHSNDIILQGGQSELRQNHF